jgi:phosphomethylpyrimidine synthase
MKITPEVREYAARQTAQDHPGNGSEARAGDFAGEADAVAGMEEMSKRFHDEGGEIYVPAAE